MSELFTHETTVWFAKSYGLVYMMLVFLGAVVYALWPANRDRFEEAANAIIADEDKPWR